MFWNLVEGRRRNSSDLLAAFGKRAHRKARIYLEAKYDHLGLARNESAHIFCVIVIVSAFMVFEHLHNKCSS